MIVRESISFERHRDPKRALGLLPYEFWWDNLAPGDKFEIIEDIPGLKYKKGDYIEIVDVTPIEHNEKKIIRNTYRGNEELNYNRSWEFGFEFFKENFKKIPDKVRESISFERYKDPKAALGLSIAGDLLKFADKKVKEKDWSWVGLKGDSEFKKADDWAWEIEFEPSLNRETKDLWINWLKEIKKYHDIKREK